MSNIAMYNKVCLTMLWRKEAIDSKEVICFTNVYKGTLLGLYPGLEGLYKILNFESELLEVRFKIDHATYALKNIYLLL